MTDRLHFAALSKTHGQDGTGPKAAVGAGGGRGACIADFVAWGFLSEETAFRGAI